MGYTVKEIFYSLQGEGAHAGQAAVFCRFNGCNLWSGREKDRLNAICSFCDTDFVGTDGQSGGKFKTAKHLAHTIASAWQADTSDTDHRYVIFTGGEPLLQLDELLIESIHRLGFTIAIETNGTLPLPSHIDWVCVSPKANTELVVCRGDELKLVFPQLNAPPDKFVHLHFRYFFLQPLDNHLREQNTQAALRYCLQHPRWRLSLQNHKFLGIR